MKKLILLLTILFMCTGLSEAAELTRMQSDLGAARKVMYLMTEAKLQGAWVFGYDINAKPTFQQYWNTVFRATLLAHGSHIAGTDIRFLRDDNAKMLVNKYWLEDCAKSIFGDALWEVNGWDAKKEFSPRRLKLLKEMGITVSENDFICDTVEAAIWDEKFLFNEPGDYLVEIKYQPMKGKDYLYFTTMSAERPLEKHLIELKRKNFPGHSQFAYELGKVRTLEVWEDVPKG